jgi:hypothetical protein
MPKLSQKLTATTAVTTEIKLTNKPMVVARCEEHATLGREITEKQGRQQRIREEVQDIVKKEKQGKALLGGTELDGHKMKVVIGHSSRFDKQGFMKKHGLSQADFDEFTEVVDNEPYLKITHPGEEDED